METGGFAEMIGFFESLSGLMGFTSVAYLVLLTLTAVAYFSFSGARSRAMLLVLVSVTFYLTLSPSTLIVLVLVAAFSYTFGLLLDHSSLLTLPSTKAQWRKPLLVIGVSAIVAVLVIYKYVPFFSRIAVRLFGVEIGASDWTLNHVVLPLGVSFWTFQAIAYLVDVYRSKTPALSSPLYFMAAMTYFPIVTSGPITRVQVLTEQFERHHSFDYERMQSGLLLIGLGFFKKLMIADRLAVFVNTVFDNPGAVSAKSNGLLFLIASVFFSIQLYCDFSGYTDIVRGSSRLFGVELPINFSAPYFSRSVREFWRRWHMTLMDWFREYVYIPLGGSRRGALRKRINVLAVFALSGLWHGAGLTYLAWGLLNGLYIVAGDLLEPVRRRLVVLLRINRESFAHRVFQTVMTFALITVSWVFFRAQSTTDALYILPRMFSPTVWVLTDGTLLKQGLTAAELLVALVSVMCLGVVEWLSMRMNLLEAIRRQHLIYRWAAYYALITAIVVLGHYGGTFDAAKFLYFKY